MKSFEKLEILRAAVCIVGVDGKIDDQELQLVEKLAKEIGVGRASREAMIDRAIDDPDFHKQMFRVLKTETDQTMLIMFHAAMVDGELEDSEIEVLKHFAAKLDVSDETFEKLVGKAQAMTKEI
ncbi:hypothetical protein N9189_02830 [Pirellulaceae bacterium]|nr:hypothetical protein [Pirellulaceae bacterium]